MYEGLLIDLPSSLGLARGVQEGFLRTPGPLPVKLLGGAVGGTVGGIMTYTPGEIIARGDPTGLTGFEGIFPSEPLPSQRAAVEAARTYTGALSGLMLLPGALKQGTVNLAGEKLIRNIENMAPGLKRSLATAGQKNCFWGRACFRRRCQAFWQTHDAYRSTFNFGPSDGGLCSPLRRALLLPKP